MRRPGILLTAAIAWVGVVLGHLAAYVLTYPSEEARHLHLALTGHGWVALAATSVLAVVPVILLTFGLRSVRAPWSGRALALSLGAIQVPAFLAIEVLEREWSVERAVSDPAVLIGLILQPLVAVLAAWVLELVRRTVRTIVALLLPPRPAVPRSFPRPGLLVPSPRSWAFLPARLRAPPVPACD